MVRNTLNRAESVEWIKMIILLEKKGNVREIGTFPVPRHNDVYFSDIQSWRDCSHVHVHTHNRASFVAVEISNGASYVWKICIANIASNTKYYNEKEAQASLSIK